MLEVNVVELPVGSFRPTLLKVELVVVQSFSCLVSVPKLCKVSGKLCVAFGPDFHSILVALKLTG